LRLLYADFGYYFFQNRLEIAQKQTSAMLSRSFAGRGQQLPQTLLCIQLTIWGV
jgi:hypothetical protein